MAARRVWRVVLAHQMPVSAAPTSVPSERVLGGVGGGELEGVDPVGEPGDLGQRCCELGVGHRPEAGFAEVVEIGVGARDDGCDRVGLAFVEYRCHTGNSGTRHRQFSPSEPGHFGRCGEVFSRGLDKLDRRGQDALLNHRLSVVEERAPASVSKPPARRRCGRRGFEPGAERPPQPPPCGGPGVGRNTAPYPSLLLRLSSPPTARSSNRWSRRARWRSLLDQRRWRLGRRYRDRAQHALLDHRTTGASDWSRQSGRLAPHRSRLAHPSPWVLDVTRVRRNASKATRRCVSGIGLRDTQH